MYWEFQRGATYISVEIQDVMMGCFHLTLNIYLVYYLLLRQTYPCQKFSYNEETMYNRYKYKRILNHYIFNVSNMTSLQ